MTAPSLPHRVSMVEQAIARLAETLAEIERQRAEDARQRAEDARQRAEEARQRAEAEAQRRAEIDRQRAEEERRRAEAEAQRRAEIDRQRAEDAREWRRERGDLVRKFGKMAEDMVAPSIPRIVETLFGVPDERISHVAVRARRRDDGRSCEVDVVAAWPGWWLVVEVKTDAQPEDVRGLLRKLRHVRHFFPEYADRKLVAAIASLDFHPTLALHAERHGLIVVAFGDDLMEVRNSKGFVPRVF